MNEIRNLCQMKLTNPAQDLEASNRMWNERAVELSRLSARTGNDGYFSFFNSSAELAGASVIDLGCGAGRYLRMLLDAGAKAEGLDPSIEMVKIAKAYVSEGGYSDVPVYNASFQDFEVTKQYDYVFVSNCPIIDYYENYLKILRLASKGVFIGSWIERKDAFLDVIAADMGLTQKKAVSFDLVYLFNLFVADGYLPKFQVIARNAREDVALEDCALRFASWLFGSGYTPQDADRLTEALSKRLTPEEKVPTELRGIRGMMYVDLGLRH